MTPVEVAERLEFYANQVRRIRGVSRTNPSAFVEDKSELAGQMLAEARRLRTPDRDRPMPATFRPGVLRVAGRVVQVEVRRRSA